MTPAPQRLSWCGDVWRPGTRSNSPPSLPPLHFFTPPQVTDACSEYWSESLLPKIGPPIAFLLSLPLILVFSSGYEAILDYMWLPLVTVLACVIAAYILGTLFTQHQEAVDKQLVALCSSSAFIDADVAFTCNNASIGKFFKFYPKGQAPDPVSVPGSAFVNFGSGVGLSTGTLHVYYSPSSLTPQ